MRHLDYVSIVQQAWKAYGSRREIDKITDLSPQVSTNHVYKVAFASRGFVIAKLAHFGTHIHFHEEHSIINQLATDLAIPFNRVLARSLNKNGKVFTYRYQQEFQDFWVVFYEPVPIRESLPKRLSNSDIANLGRQMGRFHKACAEVTPQLPESSKTVQSDIYQLLSKLYTTEGKMTFGHYSSEIRLQCDLFFQNIERLGYDQFLKMPVFVDWNIGNFSIDKTGNLFSRWDYDWFRMSSRVMDFYFLSRVVSDIGDRTVFSYWMEPLMEERFLYFLTHYHAEYPLTEAEVKFIPEAYRFFILHYVLSFGKHFFHPFYATRLQQEAIELYLPSINTHFDASLILRTLGI
ncbi:MAG: hypothetical protein AAFN10_18040 [Bacteroidota bacterium]